MLSSVSQASERLCRQMGISSDLQMLEKAWETEMGSWGNMAQLVALDRSSLVVEVESSPAMQEILLRRRELIRRINKHFTVPFIQTMTVRLAQHG